MAVSYNSDEVHGTWSGGSGTLATFTSAAGADAVVVAMQGYPLTAGDDPAITIAGNAVDDTLRTRDPDGDSAFICIGTTFTPNTGQAVAWSGVDSGDAGDYGIYSVTGSDVTELQATGFPDTGTDTATNGVVSATVSAATGDLVVDSAEGYDTSTSSNRAAPDAGQTEIYEQINGGSVDTRGAASYKPGAASVTTGYTFTFANDATYVVAIIPAAASGHTGTGTPTLGTVTASGVGEQPHEGQGALALSDLEVAAVGAEQPEGQAALELSTLAVSAAGQMPAEGQGIINVPAVSLAAVAQLPTEGAGVVALQAIISAAVAEMPMAGAGAISLEAISLLGVGDLPTVGVGTISLGSILAATISAYIYYTDQVGGAGAFSNLNGDSVSFSDITGDLISFSNKAGDSSIYTDIEGDSGGFSDKN